MKEYRITFLKEGIIYKACEGMTVLEAEIAAGLTPDSPCGGKGSCGKCKVKINGKPALACRTAIYEDMTVETEEEDGRNVRILMEGCRREVAFLPEKFPEDVEHPLLAAVDLGSTSVVVYLLDGLTGRLLSVKSMLNPQRQYGADVVMRSSYALEKGADLLSGCIRRAVTVLLREAARECGSSWEEIVQIVMVGNTCMHHLFLEISTESLILAPYEPKVKSAVRVKASQCGILVHPQAEVCWLPVIGGFVGADTVGCLLASAVDKNDEMTLIVYIGTNGEMVLGNRFGLTACSTAAGPAFEGAKIMCGMRGSTGAIDHVYLKDGAVSYHVIGDTEPMGICGSGLLDAAACLLEQGLIDETGRMKETYYFTSAVYITQKDIRELQLAKAAIAAGIRLLCKHRGIAPGEIQKLLLAGAFGNYLKPESACAVGLLPVELKERICAVGNAAGEGAQIAVLNRLEYERAEELASRTDFLELATDPKFQEIYVEEMEFPV